MVFRRLQLWEEVYGQQLRIAENGDAADPWLDERSLLGRERAGAVRWWRRSLKRGCPRSLRKKPH